jgi:hypothetical protein
VCVFLGAKRQHKFTSRFLQTLFLGVSVKARPALPPLTAPSVIL